MTRSFVVYVAVDNPKGTIQFGGTVAAPIVGNIMGDSLRALGVKPRKEQIEKVRKGWDDPVMIEVPDMVGMTKTEIREIFVNFKIDASGQGNTVVKQTPQGGIKLKEGSTIRLYFDDPETTDEKEE